MEPKSKLTAGIRKAIDVALGNEYCIKIFYLICVSIHLFVPVADALGFIVKLSLVYGVMVFIYDFFTEKKFIKCRYFKLTALFLFFLLLSIFVNASNGLAENIKIVLYTILEFLIIASCSQKKNKDEIRREISIFSLIMWILILIAAIAAFVTFCTRLEITYMLESGVPCYLGIASSVRLSGWSGNPNQLGMQMMLGIALSIVLLYTSKFRGKWLFVLGALFDLTCLMLSGSRASIVALMCFLVLFFFFLLLERIKERITFWRVVGRVAASIALAAAVYAAGLGLRTGAGYLPPILERIGETQTQSDLAEQAVETDGEEIAEETENTELTAVSTARVFDASSSAGSGRLKLWKAALVVFRHHPWFGVGKEALADYATLYNPDSSLSGINHSVHNIFLQVLSCSGIFSFLTFVILGCLWLKDSLVCLKIILNTGKREDFLVYCALFSLLLMVLVHAMFEVVMIYGSTVTSVAFFAFWGYQKYYLNRFLKADNSAERISD